MHIVVCVLEKRYILDDQLFPNNPLYSSVSSLGLGIVSTLIFQPLVTLVPSSQGEVKSIANKYSQLLSSPSRAKTLFGIYGLAWSCVLVWRGTWLGWDLLYEQIVMKMEELNAWDNPSAFSNHILQADNDASNPISSNVWKKNTSTMTTAGQEIVEDVKTLQNSTHIITTIDSSAIHHGTRSGLASHLTAVILLTSFGLLASVFAPPARIAVLRDTRFIFTRISK